MHDIRNFPSDKVMGIVKDYLAQWVKYFMENIIFLYQHFHEIFINISMKSDKKIVKKPELEKI